MSNFFKHLHTVNKHRYLVFVYGMKIGFGLRFISHDLSKYSKEEFHNSYINYKGYESPVYNERLTHNYFSSIVRHHVGRNKHHWEYYVDIFQEHMIIKTMPYRYIMEYVVDVISASKTYNPKSYNNDEPYKYVSSKIDHYYMSKATKEFLLYAFKEFSLKGFKGIHKKNTYKKYLEITSKYPDVEHYKIKLEEPNIIKNLYY